METTITIRSDSVTIDRDIGEGFDLAYSRKLISVEDDKTFLIANLLVPKITELMELSMDELRAIHLEMISVKGGRL